MKIIFAAITLVLFSASQLPAETAASHYLRADKLRKAGKLDDAIIEYLFALEKKPDSLPTKKALAACQSIRTTQLKDRLDRLTISLALNSPEGLYRETARIAESSNMTAPKTPSDDAALDREIADIQKQLKQNNSPSSLWDRLIAAQDSKITSQKRALSALNTGHPEAFPKSVGDSRANPDNSISDPYGRIEEIVNRFRDINNSMRTTAQKAMIKQSLPPCRVQWQAKVTDVSLGPHNLCTLNLCCLTADIKAGLGDDRSSDTELKISLDPREAASINTSSLCEFTGVVMPGGSMRSVAVTITVGGQDRTFRVPALDGNHFPHVFGLQ